MDTLVEICKNWLRNAKAVETSTLDAQLRQKAEDWFARGMQLFKEAQRACRDGETRDSFVFDDLKKRSLKLADEVFVSKDRGLVFGKVAQIFDGVFEFEEASESTEKPKPAPKKTAAVPANGETWRRYPPLPSQEARLLDEVQKFACWDPTPPELETSREAFERAYPRDGQLLELALANGRLFRKVKEKAFSLGLQKNGWEMLSGLLDATRIPGFLEKKIMKSFESGQAAKARQQEAKRLNKIRQKAEQDQRKTAEKAVPNGDQPREKTLALKPQAAKGIRFPLTSAHANSILNLKASPHWTIVADETGVNFNDAAFKGGASVGRYVFVLIPDGVTLPGLAKGWHAKNLGIAELLKAADDLQAAGCGILGISVRNLYKTHRDLWRACITTTLDLTLRLLPLDGETRIDLKVEQRGGDVGLSQLMDDAMYRLSLIDPHRAEQIDLHGDVIEKTDCPWNGYADLVAYSWGCGQETRKVFRPYGWREACLVAEDTREVATFQRCLELVHQAGALPEADWCQLVTCQEGTAVGSLVGALLRASGEAAQEDPALWRTYLGYTLGHLDSKAIRLSVLGRQIAWLKAYEPAEEILPPRLRLLWLTAQLATSNHLGGTQFGTKQYGREFADLLQRLKDEDAPLTCFAALNLAVELTDCYKFEEARALLLPWKDEPIAVPGLRYYAQVLSSLGQHEAFLGNNTCALDYFDQAVAQFRRLSVPAIRDIDQTTAYAVIAAQDAGAPQLKALLATYFACGEFSEASMANIASDFAGLDEKKANSKYAHAILLRYLVTLPESDPIRQAYVKARAKWQTSEDGHPWEVIEFYRALLLPEEAKTRLDTAYRVAVAAGGETLMVIAAVIAGSALALGLEGEWAQRFETMCTNVSGMEGLRATGRDKILAEQPTARLPPLELAQKVLPFNFR